MTKPNKYIYSPQVALDKLSVTGHIGLKARDKKQMRTVFHKLKEEGGDDVFRVKKCGKQTGYKYSVFFQNVFNPMQTFRVDYGPHKQKRRKRRKYLRIEFSPQHYTNGLQELFDWLSDEARLGVKTTLLFRNAIVTRVDVKLDILGVLPRQFCVALNYVFVGGSTHGRDGVQGWKLGSSKSRKQLAVYEKEFLHLGEVKDCDASIRPLVGAKGTRFEFRLRPRVKLSELKEIRNPYRQLNIYRREVMDDDLLPKWFRVLLSVLPISVALSLADDDNLKRRIKRRLDKHQEPLFHSDLIWKDWDDALERISAITF